MSKIYTFCCCALFLSMNLPAQLTVSADRTDATYDVGQQMNFIVTGGGDGAANYIIRYDRGQAPNIEEGTIQVTGGTANLPFKLDHPGMVFCYITLNGQSSIAGAAFSPFQIQPYEDDPDDFDNFWEGWKNQLAAVPMNAVVTPLFPDPSPQTRDFRINLGHIDGRRVYGYLSIPNAPGSYPAIITHASFGGFANLCIPRPEIAINANVISLSIWMHNREPDQNDPTAYMPEVWDDRERIFYRYGVLGIVRAIDFIHTLPDFNGEDLGLFGVSEGGGLSILAAGVDNRVDIVGASIFALSEHTGYKYDRASGFPFFLVRSNTSWPPVVNENAVTASKYYDAVRAAKRFDGPFYGAVGYIDETVMPATNFGAYNQFKGSTVLVHKIKGPHLSPVEFGEGKFDFMKKHFNLPGNTGYFADAGDDIFNAPGQVSLSGKVELNGTERTDFPVEWEKVSGPGDVIFSNKYARQTNVSFTVSGEYVLRFRATDQSMLAANETYFTVTDHVIVSSTDSSNPCAEDDIPPTAGCRDFIIELTELGTAKIFTGQIKNGSTDNCTEPQYLGFELNRTDFSCADIGGNTVELTVTDASGNQSTCSAVITVTENRPPIALCNNSTVLLDATGNADLSYTEINNGSFDNCTASSDLIYSLNRTGFNCSDIGISQVELSVTDARGNIGKCISTITVTENVMPTAVCANRTIELDAAGNAELTAEDFGAGSYDNCTASSNLLLNINRTSFGCADIGLVTVSLTVTDESGNTAACTANITVTESVSPYAQCQNIRTELDVNGIAVIQASEINNGSWDNCTPSNRLAAEINHSVFDCTDIGVSKVVLTISDESGNTATCESEITVADLVKPVADCRDLTILLDANGNAEITPEQINAGSFDNCPTGLSLNLSRTSFDCSDAGNRDVELSVTDSSGNSSVCTSNIKISDKTPPIVACRDIVLQLDANGIGQILPSDIDAGTTDNCSADLNFTISKTDFSCVDTGVNQVELTATDDYGNSANCTSVIQVIENVLPTAVCRNLTIELDAQGTAQINAEEIDSGSFDNCTPSISLIKTIDRNQLNCSDLGFVSVELTVEDGSGNKHTCQSEVTVLDVTPPTAVCDDLTIELDSFGQAEIMAADIDAGSFDNCTPSVLLNFTLSETGFTVSDIGEIPVNLTVIDASGNISGCISEVTIRDYVSSTEEAGSQELDFEVFPNPTEDYVWIQFSDKLQFSKERTIQLFNNMGQLIKIVPVEQMNDSIIKLDLEHLPSGVYHIFVLGTYRRGVRKLILE